VRCDNEAVIGDSLNLDRWGVTFWWGLDTRWGSDGSGSLSRKVSMAVQGI